MESVSKKGNEPPFPRYVQEEVTEPSVRDVLTVDSSTKEVLEVNGINGPFQF